MHYNGEKYSKSERVAPCWLKRSDQTKYKGPIRTPAAMDLERVMKNP